MQPKIPNNQWNTDTNRDVMLIILYLYHFFSSGESFSKGSTYCDFSNLMGKGDICCGERRPVLCHSLQTKKVIMQRSWVLGLFQRASQKAGALMKKSLYRL